MVLGRGLVEPGSGGCRIARNGTASLIHDAEVELRARVTLLGGSDEPFSRLRDVLRDTIAEVIDRAQVELRDGMSLRCGFGVPCRGFRHIPGNAGPAAGI